MELRFRDNLPAEEWDRFVSSHPSGSFLQSPGWGEWMETQGRQTMRPAVTDNDGSILVGAQILTTAIPKLGGHYIYVPYGPLTVGENPDALNLFLDSIKKRFTTAWFLRLEPKQFLLAEDRVTPHTQPGKTLVLDLTKSEEELLSDMHHKTRYNIRVAERHGVVVETGNVAEAVALIQETSKRQGFKDHPAQYYTKLCEFFASNKSVNTKTYTTSFNGRILASSLMVDYGPTRTYLFGGTHDADRNVMAPYLMHWQAIKDAKQKGFKTYDFWGIETASGQTPGFVRFKLGWGGQQIHYPSAEDIVYKPLWYNAYKLLRALNRKLS